MSIMKRHWRAGVVVSGAHLILWIGLLFSKRGTVYFGDPTWNLFPFGTVWYYGYLILNAPVELLYRPIARVLFQGLRHGLDDVALTGSEIATNYAFHLLGFAIWWYVLTVWVVTGLERLRRR